MSSSAAVLERPLTSIREAALEESGLAPGLVSDETDDQLVESSAEELLALYEDGSNQTEALDDDHAEERIAEAQEAAEEEYAEPPARPERDEELQIWMSRARVAQLLTADEEIRLARAVQRGDKRAKDKLTEANL